MWIEQSTDESELEMDGSDASALAFLANRREEAEKAAQSGAQDTPEAEVAEGEGEQQEVAQEPQEAVDEDPEIDLGDIKLKRSELKAGYMKDADYRRKTSEAAEVKREAQAEREQIRAERTQYANHLDVLIHSLQTQLVGDQQALAQLAESDPAEWVRQNAAIQQRYANYQAAVHERQQLANRTNAEQEAEAEEWRKGEAEALKQKLPEWSDAKVKEAESQQVAQFLLSMGYDAKEISGLFDHRALLVARKAAFWDAHQANLKAAKEKQDKTPPKPVKPGVAGNQNQQVSPEALNALRKRGDTDSAMAWLAAKRKT